jgi:hypothetical protein
MYLISNKLVVLGYWPLGMVVVGLGVQYTEPVNIHKFISMIESKVRTLERDKEIIDVKNLR